MSRDFSDTRRHVICHLDLERELRLNEENPDEAADIVLENDASGAQTEKHQKRMMGEIAKLTAGSNGALDEADFKRTVNTLLKGGSDPVITTEPVGAWTSAITDKALK